MIKPTGYEDYPAKIVTTGNGKMSTAKSLTIAVNIVK